MGRRQGAVEQAILGDKLLDRTDAGAAVGAGPAGTADVGDAPRAGLDDLLDARLWNRFADTDDHRY
jgi:hypothetical protein